MAAPRTHYKKKPKVQPSMSIFSVLLRTCGRPHDVDAEFLQIVEFLDNLTQVVDTVAIGIVGESHDSRGKGAAIGFWRSLSELIG